LSCPQLFIFINFFVFETGSWTEVWLAWKLIYLARGKQEALSSNPSPTKRKEKWKETGSHYVFQASLELVILLPQPPE
jgi:hypothetical protein